jgi:hypothetical protein
VPSDYHLLDEVQRDALDRSCPVSDTLRKLIALGGDAGSVELREWAGRELRGYQGDLPSYRRPRASILLDAINGNYRITGQEISPRSLPAFAHEHITQEVPMARPVGELEAMLQECTSGEGFVRINLPLSQDLLRVMNRENDNPYQRIQSIYWAVSSPTIAGVIDQIRTVLVELVTEIRAYTPPSAVPSASVANNALNVAVHGKSSRVTIAANNTVHGDQNQVASEHEVDEPPSRVRRFGVLVVGIATVAAALVAVAEWQNWSL